MCGGRWKRAVGRVVGAALVAACCLTGCADQPLRDEGSAPEVSVAPSRAPDLRRVNVRELLLADPLVRERVKSAIRACAPGCGIEQTGYADLTGDGVDELRVSVSEERTAGPIAAYVYGVDGGVAKQLWAYHGRSFSAVVENGELVLQRDLFRPPDLDEPASAELIIFAWDGKGIAEVDKVGAEPGLEPVTW